MLGHVSVAGIIGMVFSLLVAVGLPVGACLFWRKRSGASWQSVLIGVVVYILFALILEQLLHSIVLNATGTILMENIWLKALYGGICAALFEETGRFLAMKFCMKRSLDKKNAIMCGIGHGGIEAILILGASATSNLIMAIMINNGQFEASLNLLEEATRADAVSQVSVLWTMPAYMFYMGGIERISAFFLHVALSYIVYRAIKDKKIIYFITAVLIHFLVDGVTLLLSGILPIPALEALLIVVVAALWVYVYKSYVNSEDRI